VAGIAGQQGTSAVDFDLEIGGRVRRLRVERQNGRFQVTVDDRVFDVDARQVSRETLSLLVREGEGAATSVDATMQSRPGEASLEVTLRGQTWPATFVSRVAARGRDSGAAGAGPQQVLSPMPGKVTRVLVQPGQAVEARQGLVVIEAMKMENELRASKAGRVRAVRVAEGQLVEAGALLVIVE
jgi:biotin carboxyl carrier protein